MVLAPQNQYYNHYNLLNHHMRYQNYLTAIVKLSVFQYKKEADVFTLICNMQAEVELKVLQSMQLQKDQTN